MKVEFDKKSLSDQEIQDRKNFQKVYNDFNNVNASNLAFKKLMKWSLLGAGGIAVLAILIFISPNEQKMLKAEVVAKPIVSINNNTQFKPVKVNGEFTGNINIGPQQETEPLKELLVTEVDFTKDDNVNKVSPRMNLTYYPDENEVDESVLILTQNNKVITNQLSQNDISKMIELGIVNQATNKQLRIQSYLAVFPNGNSYQVNSNIINANVRRELLKLAPGDTFGIKNLKVEISNDQSQIIEKNIVVKRNL